MIDEITENSIIKYLKLYKQNEISLEYATRCLATVMNNAISASKERQEEKSRNDSWEMRKQMQRTVEQNCDHHYGRKEWYGPCSYTETCTKCGHQNDGYERD
ncbi:MAG: hypothetical protein WC979_03340 [Candidatus Pacearchaeota archaeon]|jgi:hypothetical protein|nr:hypothetical protein [Clostridia bacterium]